MALGEEMASSRDIRRASPTIRLTTGQALLRFPAAQYIERDGYEQRFLGGCFGIFGHGNVAGFGQALHQHPELLTYYLNRLPVLLLPGDIFASRPAEPVLQQLEAPSRGEVSVNDCFIPVSRYFDRIRRPEQLVPAVLAAMRVLTSPAETGAVTLALSQDVQAEAYEWPEVRLSSASRSIATPECRATSRGGMFPARREDPGSRCAKSSVKVTSEGGGGPGGLRLGQESLREEAA
jgi:TPP-dependent trihydroxycyclohexane-1,2-dione (THcHDO) dehydratase